MATPKQNREALLSGDKADRKEQPVGSAVWMVTGLMCFASLENSFLQKPTNAGMMSSAAIQGCAFVSRGSAMETTTAGTGPTKPTAPVSNVEKTDKRDGIF